MYPGRLSVCLGSGEASNEHITGDPWPPKQVRNARLRECAEIIRALLGGEEVTHDGLVRVDRARLWSRPAEPPPLLGAAVSEETARWVGGWADGLATIHRPRAELERVVAAFREGGGEGKPMVLQIHLAWAPSEEEAMAIAWDQWRTNVFAPPLCWDLETPGTSTRPPGTSGPRTCAAACWSPALRRATRSGSMRRQSSASMRSTSTTSARTRTRSSTCSAATCSAALA